MRILPVLDLMDGRVVHGVGGQRHEYRPILSLLTTSSRPLDVAQAFRTHFGLTEIYLADLDGIAGGSPALATYSSLRDAGFHMWVDAGIRRAADAACLVDAGVEEVVFGLETLEGPHELARGCNLYGQRIVFSLDLRDGEPLGDRNAWGNCDAKSVVERAIAMGVRRLIILDLARVGSGAGVGTEDLCRRVIQSFASSREGTVVLRGIALSPLSGHVEVIAGGGVRGMEDLYRLQGIGVGGVLVASALHDGRICPEQLADFHARKMGLFL